MTIRETIQYRINNPAAFEPNRAEEIRAAFNAMKGNNGVVELIGRYAFRIGQDNLADAIVGGIKAAHPCEQEVIVNALIAAIGNYAVLSGVDDRNRHSVNKARRVREALTGDFFPRGE